MTVVYVYAKQVWKGEQRYVSDGWADVIFCIPMGFDEAAPCGAEQERPDAWGYVEGRWCMKAPGHAGPHLNIADDGKVHGWSS